VIEHDLNAAHDILRSKEQATRRALVPLLGLAAAGFVEEIHPARGLDRAAAFETCGF
jgi:hypothetical protein